MARKRVVLNSTAVREIESLAPSFAERMRRGATSQLSNALSSKFGVDAKTVRDIWNRKSWKEFTKTPSPLHAEPAAEEQERVQQTFADSFLLGGDDTA